jgi:peptidoglycan/LPS O-acetylase OafA/YrhL
MKEEHVSCVVVDETERSGETWDTRAVLRAGAGDRDRVPVLDGIRCLAVLSVMAFHSGVPGLRVGGFFGVDVFFVLSGYLITSLLLGERLEHGRIRLGAFWGRRARRLLPALAVMVEVVALYVALVAPPGRYPAFRGDVLSVAFYFSNWHFISAASNYFATTGRPSLLTHTWSLAIEEQFYLVWPVALIVLGVAARRMRRRLEVTVLVVSIAGALASSAWMAVLYRHGASPSRLYYGTDTHAECLLVGAALAALFRIRAQERPARSARLAGSLARARLMGAIQVGSVVGLAWLMCTVGGTSPFAFQGGFLVVAVLTAALISTLVLAPRSGPGRALSMRGPVFVGRISYGMYLWYFPLFEVLTRSSTGLRGLPLFGVRTAVDIAVATASFYALEVPIRRVFSPGPDPAIRFRSMWPVATVGAAVVAVFSLVGLGSAAPAAVAVGLPPMPPGGTDRPPVRILVTGDSTGLTLGLAWSFPDLTKAFGVVVDDEGQLGCGVAVSVQVLVHGTAASPPPSCNASTPVSGQWPALLRATAERFRPDVVVIAAGRWEVLSRRDSPEGPWENITQAAGERYVRDQLDVAIAAASSTGARVAVATAPCFSTGEQPDGSAWPEDAPDRRAAYDTAVHDAVRSHPQTAFVLDLGSAVCPGGTFHQSLDGVVVRAPDGIHYPFFTVADPSRADPNTLAETDSFGRWAANRFMPSLIAAGESVMRRAG